MRIKIMPNSFKSIISAFLFALVFVISIPHTASAYLDPGTGSYLFQVIVLSIMGFLFTLKMYWQRFIAFLKSLMGKKESDGNG